MEKIMSRSSLLLWLSIAVLVSQNLVVPVMCRAFGDEKTYYPSPTGHGSGSSPRRHHGHRGHHRSPSNAGSGRNSNCVTPPSSGGGSITPTPSTPDITPIPTTPTSPDTSSPPSTPVDPGTPSSPSGGGSYGTPTPSTPHTSSPPSTPVDPGTPSSPSGGGSYGTPTPDTSSPPSTPVDPGTPSSPSGGGSYGTPTPATPDTSSPPSTPIDPGTPSSPSGGGSYGTPTPDISSPPSTDPGTPSSPSGGGGYGTPTTPSTPNYTPTPTTPATPDILGPPSTPISVDPGTPSTPMFPGILPPPSSLFPPFLPDPSSPFTGTCNFWRSHPDAIWSLLGWWGTMGNMFSLPTSLSFPSFPGAGLTLPQALSNTRTDGLGELYREGTASLLNSMANSRFPYSTQQVRDQFAAGLVSDRAAAAQAQLFRLANEGRVKPRA